MSMVSDIPDWCFFESGLPYSYNKIPSASDYSIMLEKSPVVRIPNIKAPILIFVGERDARVPSSQGKAFYRLLKGNQKEAKLISYPNGSHPLKNAKVNGDYFMNTYKWFIEHKCK